MDTPKVEAQTLADMQRERGLMQEQGSNTSLLDLRAKYAEDTQFLIEKSKKNFDEIIVLPPYNSSRNRLVKDRY